MFERRGFRFGREDPLLQIGRAVNWLFTQWIRATYSFHSLGRKVSFHRTCDLWNTNLIQIGDYVTLHRDVWLHAHISPQNQGEPALVIGDRCFIARRCHISAKNLITIERNVIFAASVLVEDHRHSYEDVTQHISAQGMTEGGRIRIGEGSWIGQGAAIFCDNGELSLGAHCVVAANAVVTRSAPPYSVLAGNPARVVKQFDPAKGAWGLGTVLKTVGNESTSGQR